MKFWRLITSIKSFVVMALVLLGLLLWGGFIMSASQEFASINSMGLFQWLKNASLWAGWWLWASVVVVGFMVLSALACTVESLRKKRPWSATLLRISIEIMHIGFCLIMFAHFIDAMGSFHKFYIMPEGTLLKYSDGHFIKYKGMDYSFNGRFIGRTDAVFISDTGQKILIGPNRPYFYNGTGLYLKQFNGYSIMVELSYEPGALWALAGGLLFMTGSVLVFMFRLRDRSVQ